MAGARFTKLVRAVRQIQGRLIIPEVAVSSKDQIVPSKNIRAALGLREGDCVSAKIEGDSVRVPPIKSRVAGDSLTQRGLRSLSIGNGRFSKE